MSYHGFGLTAGLMPIDQGVDPVSQPTGSIAPMATINNNPWLEVEPGAGEQALIMEMQSRKDPTSVNPESYQAPIPLMTAPVNPSTIPVSPLPGLTPSTGAVSDEQALQLMMQFWKAVFGGDQPPASLAKLMESLMASGKGYIVARAEEMVLKGSGSVPAGVASTNQPAEPIMTQGPPGLPMPQETIPTNNYQADYAPIQLPPTGMKPPLVPNPGQPIPQWPPVAPMPTYPTSPVPNPGLPIEPTQEWQQQLDKCPTGYFWQQGANWVGCADAEGNRLTGDSANPVGPIATNGTKPTGEIPEYTDPTKPPPPPPGMPPPIPTYSKTPLTEQEKLQQQLLLQKQKQTTTEEKKTSYVPIIAVAVGALLLTKIF